MKRLLVLLGQAFKTVLQIMLALAAGACIYALAAALIGDSSSWTWLVAFVVAPLFTIPAVLIHELGHAFVAARSGWIVERIVVWPLGYSTKKRTWSFVSRPVGGGDIGGWVVTHPAPGRGSRNEETLVLLGGVAANAVAAGLCMIIAGFLPYGSAKMILGAFAVFSIVQVIFNVIPWKIGGQATDGLQLWRLWMGHRPARTPSRRSRSEWNTPRKW
jgi:hypothetical protein